jgi:hypothetical protein
MYIYTKQSSWNSNFSTLEPDGQQRDCPTVFVIAQQYSPATFVSLPFHSRKEKLGAFKKYYCSIFCFFKKCLESEIV